jgi:integrase
MAQALTQKRIDALLKKRPAGKLEIADGGQAGLYFVVGPRALKWMVRYRSPGTSQNVKLAIADYGQEKPALGLHDARKAAHATLQAVAEGRDPRTSDDAAARRHVTVEGAFADFIERHSRLRNKASTAGENEAFVRREILPKWRGRRIQSITRQDIVRLVDRIADGGQGQAPRPQSAVRVRALLSKAFSWFAAKSIVPESPFVNIEVPAPPTARDRILSDDELRWLWKATAEVGHPFGELVRLLLRTGQRRDEVAAARWEEFDLVARMWSIPPARTKNKRAQVLPLPAQVVEILEALPTKDDCPFILSTNGKTPISGYSRAKKQIDRAMLEAARSANPQVEIKPWTLHDLRRTAASGMAAIGIGPHVVEQVLNHKSGVIAGVAAIYNRHSYIPEKRDALAAWSNLLDRITGTTNSENVVELRAS